jgi:predicted O-methyltransferase YrrM
LPASIAKDCQYAQGAVVVADNVLSPGPGKLPAYLDYVRSNNKFASVLHESFVEYQAELKDGVEVTTYVG